MLPFFIYGKKIDLNFGQVFYGRRGAIYAKFTKYSKMINKVKEYMFC